MKPKFYTTAIMLFSFLSFNFPFSKANPVMYAPFATPIPGVTDFNSLYTGSYVNLAGPGSAGGTGMLAANVSGYDFRLLASSNISDCGIGIDQLTGQTALVYGFTNNGFTDLTALDVSSNDGKFFDLKSVDITIDGLSSGSTGDIRLVGYIGSTPIAGAVLMQTITAVSSGGTLVNFDVSANLNFIGINKFRIETDGSYTITGAIGIDNVNAINFRNILLPVTLLSYNAAARNNTALLQWETVNEINCSHFIIEKSSNGIDFATMGTIPCYKTYGGFSEYNFIDAHPFAGNNFYRLRLVDNDGLEKILGIKKLSFAYNINPSVFPNPVAGSSLTLQTGATTDGKLSYIIIDASGKINGRGVVSNPLQQIDVSGISKGLYFLRLNNGNTIKFEKE